ncbi:MAG TPA: tetratricopeptide repeat protein [Hyphomonas sp.]|nr:tetratricopeptide repeat protein [Hyphomonas sp.]MCA8903337.1 tetratricopeptide repeat protein [Hyphomonas sp.]MCB9962254.1 tetratricopeptide repeat protein [Hyphomonas sp.]HPE46912.1 tetratricopeptide repeat protein [Hyphomonas sp.]
MKRLNLAILGGCLVVAVAGYFAMGRPGMPDEPMAKRQEGLAEKIRTAPETLTEAETLSRLELATQQKPDDPQPHFFIGEILRAQGRPDDAARAYQSALRRDEDYVPALIALADTLVEIQEGSVGAQATRLYARAYELDNTQVRAGMWAAMGAAQAGDQEKAEQAMRYIYNHLPEDDPRRERFKAMIETIGKGGAMAPPTPAE